MLKLFIVFLIGIIPLSLGISVFQDISYIGKSDNLVVLFKMALISSTIIKLAVGLSSILVAIALINKKVWVEGRINIILAVMLISPILIEVPFLFLEIAIESPIFSLNDMVKKLVVSVPFSMFWYMYFRTNPFLDK